MEGDRPSGRDNFAQNRYENGKINASDDGNYNLGKGQGREKINSIVILIVGIFALGFGYYQLTSNINNPFSFLKAVSGNPSQADSQQLAMDNLKNQDSDGDGLSDYDELYVYHTSPYLADSDGDGIPDGQEVKQGTDPNCPEGRTCFAGGSNGTTSSSTAGAVPTWQTTPPNQPNSQIDVATLRKVLVQGGISQADVDAMTDSDIITLYQQTLSENPGLAQQMASSTGITAPSVVSTNTSTTIPAPPKQIDVSSLNLASMDDLKALSGAQIKALMIKNGAPAALLNSISDDELKQMFLDKLNSSSGSSSTGSFGSSTP